MDTPPVHYVKTSDGWNIGYCVSGNGRPLVLLPPALSSIQLAWTFFPDWLQGLASRFQLIQLDLRGEGASQRGLPEGTMASDFLLDIAAVVERLNLQRFMLSGWGSRSHHAIRYADAYPDQIEALILNNTSLTGAPWRGVLYSSLPLDDWDAFLRAVLPRGLSPDEDDARMEELRQCITPQDWDIMVACTRAMNVEAEVRRLGVPTLILHPRNRSALLESAREMAALIPNSRFAIIDEPRVFGDAAQALAAIDSFLADLEPLESHGQSSLQSEREHHSLSEREVEVLRLLARGSSNQQIADELVISLNTVRRHVSNIFDKTGVANRAQAAVYAKEHGLI